MRAPRGIAVAVLLGLVVALTSCTAPNGADQADGSSASSVEDEGRAFYAAQGFAADGERLAPKTPEQQLLVQEAIDSAVWTGVADDDLAWMSLELTVDACLAAIEAEHRVDASLVSEYIDAPGTIPRWANAFADADTDIALPFMLGGLAITGMKHLCPDDYPGWIAAYRELPVPGG